MDNTGRMIVFPGQNGLFYFHWRAGNGEIICASQGYTRRHDAARGARRVNSEVPLIHRYLPYTAETT